MQNIKNNLKIILIFISILLIVFVSIKIYPNLFEQSGNNHDNAIDKATKILKKALLVNDKMSI